MPILITELSIDNGLMFRLHRQSRDRDWIRENYLEISKAMPRTYVAVQNREVVYHSESMIELMALILDNGHSTDDFVFEYLAC